MTRPFSPPFSSILTATFVSRPNRFLVHADLPTGVRVKAFLPNPGRLQELLLPRVRIYLAPADPKPDRKTGYTMVGVHGPCGPIFLHTHVNNAVARYLIEAGQVPGLRRARIVRAEVPLGSSRFDFLLRDHRGDIYLEVKSCTLFGNRVAMFPDAVTTRGRRHLEELAELARHGTRAMVLFVVHSGAVDWFMPDYHTDPAFSHTLIDVRKDLPVLPLAISWQADFTLAPQARLLPIPWKHIATELGDRGNYIVLCRRDKPDESRGLPAGYFLYTGWRENDLFRYLRTCSKPPRARAGEAVAPAPLKVIETFPIVSSRDRQAELAAELSARFTPCITAPTPESGSWTGLSHSALDPRTTPEFHQLLARFRMSPPRVQNRDILARNRDTALPSCNE